MSEIDKTKRSTGINNMDDKSRKEMFEKFQSAGGKVVSDKEKKREESVRKQKEQPQIRQGARSQAGGKDSRPTSKQKTPPPPKPSQVTSTVRDRRALENEMGNFFNRMAVRFKCWLARVTSFSSSDLLPGFLSEMNMAGKKAILEMHFVGNDLLGNPAYAAKIAKELDSQNPIFIELLGRMHKVYDNSELTLMLEAHNAAPDMAVAVNRIRPQLYSLFKKLYYIYPFQGSYVKAVTLGYQALEKLEGKPSTVYNTKRKRALQEFDVLYGTVFDKLYLAILRCEDKNIPLLSSVMESILGILPEEKLGQRKSGEELNEISGGEHIDEEEETEEVTEEQPIDPEENLSKELKYGLKLMRMQTLDQLRKKHDPRGDHDSIPAADKALLAWLFFREFDEEYSFVMTTKKIDLKPTILNGAKMDFREKLLDLYETTRGIQEQFRIYDQYYNELSNHLKNPGANYIEASKKTSALETKKSQQSRNVRVTAKDFIQKTSELLSKLIADMKGKREVVANMDATMSFDLVEAKKRLNKKPIKQCIMEAYCFSLAFSERLENGDLFGGVPELSAEEMEKEFGIKPANAPGPEMAEPSLSSGESSDDSFGVDPSILSDEI
ncbi:hypothetical protein CH373_13840 [Leptospira perolatii]|uniref:Uncharacterized protein n=1 Tax=Leptospira perolatii TaxID=2023191 RepID=A0A2M9ZKK8_9LEPT|nr:hypothetical protein [Leptospira perolatii]PJZ69424.1 hypothetical protein CH360_11405 [Leptospira perolatii]PJZ72578.1 hypothetical protein CH373_13840 [Leptospira perolatii]